MRILVIQKAGDFREAHRRKLAGLGDQYYGHSYVLEELERLGAIFGEVAIMCCTTRESYVERLGENLLAIGAAVDPKGNESTVIEMAADWRPSHLIVNGPMKFVIQWGLASHCEVMCILADSFNGGPIRRLLRYRPLGRLLNHEGVTLIGNHGLNASYSLAKIGVDPKKIIPWDWPYSRSPVAAPVRTVPLSKSPRLLYVGTLQEDKGVGDLIHAVGVLKKAGQSPLLTIVGTGSGSLFPDLVARLNLRSEVDFLGLVPNEQVIKLMLDNHIVVVPSRPAYPEGFPLVIYEALCTRTPIVASNHPMFRGYLVDGQTASIFPAGQPEKLAARISDLLANPVLYGELSFNSLGAWEKLQNKVKWGNMIERWLRRSDPDRAWLEANSLAAIAKL